MRAANLLPTACLMAGSVLILAAGPAQTPLKYKEWKLVTPKPLQMDPVLAAMCARQPALQGSNGHAARFYRVYVNKRGDNAMGHRIAYPAGSAIVKEKLVPDGADYKVELLTVMVKHEKGYSPESADWEFYVANPKGERTAAPKELSNCISCHKDRAATDMVFGTYARVGKSSPKP